MERTPARADSRGAHRRRSASPPLPTQAGGRAQPFGTTPAPAGPEPAAPSATLAVRLGPTGGPEPAGRAEVWDIMRSSVASGATVLLTTQYLDEADALADRIAVIDNGTIIAEGTTSELKATVGSGSLRLRVADPTRRTEAGRMLTESLGVAVQAGPDPAALTATIPAGPSGSAAAEQVASALAEPARAGIGGSELALRQPSLQQGFLTLTRHP